MKAKILYFFALFIIGLSSCVPAKKYEELKSKQEQCEEDRKKYKAFAEDAETTIKNLEEELAQLKKNYKIIKNDTSLLGSSYRNLRTQYDHMERLNKEIQAKLKILQDQAEFESSQLSMELQLKQKELIKKEDELNVLASNLDKLKRELELKQADLAQKEKRVNELEELLKQKDEIVNALKDKVTQALLGFKDKGLTIEQRNGKVYVKMEAKLLFAVGSTKVGTEGRDALKKLAMALEGQDDMEVVVEGHTDTQALNSSTYPHDNWELSVLRATAVVNIMLQNSSMKPEVLTAAGRSSYHPVSEDLAKNRRIEIILTPNLDDLYDIINN